jgi:hypothetical protein
VLYPPVKPGGMSFLLRQRRTNVSPGFTVFVSRASAVDPATLLAEPTAARAHGASAPTRSRAAPDLERHPISGRIRSQAAPDLERHPISGRTRSRAAPDLAASLDPPAQSPRVERPTISCSENSRETARRRSAATGAPPNLAVGAPSCALFMLQNKLISSHSASSRGREISSPGAAVIARPRSSPTHHRADLMLEVTPPRSRSAGGRIFTDMVDRLPFGELGVAPASSVRARQRLPQRAVDVELTMAEPAAQARSGLAAHVGR